MEAFYPALEMAQCAELCQFDANVADDLSNKIKSRCVRAAKGTTCLVVLTLEECEDLRLLMRRVSTGLAAPWHPKAKYHHPGLYTYPTDLAKRAATLANVLSADTEPTDEFFYRMCSEPSGIAHTLCILEEIVERASPPPPPEPPLSPQEAKRASKNPAVLEDWASISDYVPEEGILGIMKERLQRKMRSLMNPRRDMTRKQAIVRCLYEDSKNPRQLADWESDASFVPRGGLIIGRIAIPYRSIKQKMKNLSRYDAVKECCREAGARSDWERARRDAW